MTFDFDLRLLPDVSAFVPESAFLDTKQADACRVCFEDCVVVDTNHCNVPVAYRGEHPIPFTDYFSQISLPRSEYALLLSALRTHRRAVLNSPNGALFVFGEFLEETGLLPIVRPRISPEDTSLVLRALSLLGEDGFFVSPSISRACAATSDVSDDVLHKIREQLFYINAFCNPSPFSQGIFTGSVRIANFAGCRLECSNLPVGEILIPPTEQIRLTAFLLCVFLSLRQLFNRVHASLANSTTPCLCYRVLAETESVHTSVSYTDEALHEKLPFLSLPCFNTIHFSISDQTLVFDALLNTAAPSVNSIDGHPFTLRFALDIA